MDELLTKKKRKKEDVIRTYLIVLTLNDIDNICSDSDSAWRINHRKMSLEALRYNALSIVKKKD